jgi:hypothetical protein
MKHPLLSRPERFTISRRAFALRSQTGSRQERIIVSSILKRETALSACG